MDMQWIGIFIGIMTGMSGLVLSILNYIRDNPKLYVTLSWDFEAFGNTNLEKGKKYGIVRVTNTGRRPIFISHISIITPSKQELLISDSIYGEKLCEGDSPKIYPLTQEGLEEFSAHWDKMYAVVRDSAGKCYASKPANKKPSWA
ncbi:TPA: hypothetical protein ACPSKB_002972 [Legionella feeleii]